MGHIFISYSRRDTAYARRLAARFVELDIPHWMDDRIDYGDRWWRVIDKAIDDSAAVVVVVTPDSTASEWVEREVMLAIRRRKPIFPLLLAGEEWSLLITQQHVSVFDGVLPPDEFFDRLRGQVAASPSSGRVGDTSGRLPPVRRPSQTRRALMVGAGLLVVLVTVVLLLTAPRRGPEVVDAVTETITPPATDSTDATVTPPPASDVTNDLTAEATTILDACPNSLPPRLTIGAAAEIAPGQPNTVRAGPTVEALNLGLLTAGTVITVIDGPVCADDFIWWEVGSVEISGWTVAGDADEYYLEPVTLAPGETPTCNGLPIDPDFALGSLAVVDFNEQTAESALRLLSDPEDEEIAVAQAYNDNTLQIMAGPRCVNNRWYWQVRQMTDQGFKGWVIATDQTGDPFLCPVDAPECRQFGED